MLCISISQIPTSHLQNVTVSAITFTKINLDLTCSAELIFRFSMLRAWSTLLVY